MAWVEFETASSRQLPPVAERPPVRGSASFRPVTWGVAACLLLGVSGLVRSWQDSRLDDVVRQFEPAPFSLKDLPETVNKRWRFLEGGDQRLDPKIAKIAGSSDHLIRTYIDDATGVSLTILVVYGNGQTLSGHVPEICYPSAGYPAAEPAINRAIKFDKTTAPFRSVVFTKTGGMEEDRQEVYYSFRHEGRWYPDAVADWKQFRYRPAMFKVQVARKMARTERRAVGKDEINPTEQFLGDFLAIFEHKIREATGTVEPSEGVPVDLPPIPGLDTPSTAPTPGPG